MYLKVGGGCQSADDGENGDSGILSLRDTETTQTHLTV